MAEERVDATLPELLRWIVMAAVVIAGVVLYLWLAPTTRAVVPPAGQELTP